MPKIQRKSLINLTAFRQKNGILQKQLSDYLEVSRGYVSMVESRKSTLAKESIEKIFNNPYHWDVDDLVPAYTRLIAALKYLNNTRNEQREAEGLLPSFFSMGDDGDDIEADVKYGYIGIPEYLVDSWCAGAPELNRAWLLTGEGEMLIKEGQESPSPIEELQDKVDRLEAELKECRALIEQMPEKVVAALQLMSNK